MIEFLIQGGAATILVAVSAVIALMAWVATGDKEEDWE